jgi:hypothetical protein
MMLRESLFTAALLLLFGFSAMSLSSSAAFAETAAESPAGVIGWISIEPGSGAGGSQMLSVIGHALALRPVHGRYSLEVKRKAGGGSVSNTRQGGAIDLRPGAAAVLSRNAINIGPADTLDIELKIFIDGREVFSAAVKTTGEGARGI